MSKKFRSKLFRVAVEGATTDGREIQRSWIEDMAATYNRNTYGARLNCEHIKAWPRIPCSAAMATCFPWKPRKSTSPARRSWPCSRRSSPPKR